MTFAVIVQARMGSSRLPGKVLEPLGSKTALAHCLDRCAKIPGVDVVVCAVPRHDADTPVAEEAAALGYEVSRGSETDVLKRYADAARQVSATRVMRVTSDCPFIDPDICGQVVELLDASRADYACNNMPPGLPHGLDCDVFSADLLYSADRLARNPYEREHVTPWLRTHPHLTRANLTGPGGVLARLRWTLDYPEDLAFVRAVYDELGEGAADAGTAQIAALCLRRPDLVSINAHRTDEARFKASATAELNTAPIRLAEVA